jgi:hypothetical protein
MAKSMLDSIKSALHLDGNTKTKAKPKKKAVAKKKPAAKKKSMARKKRP